MEKAGLTGSAGSEEKEHLHPRSLEGPCARPCCLSADMHRLRTTYARLRPLTVAHTAKTSPRPRLFSIERDLRTLQPARPLNSSVTAEPFLNGTSSNYLEELYYAWLENPKNVHKVLYAIKLYAPNPKAFLNVCTLCSHCILLTDPSPLLHAASVSVKKGEGSEILQKLSKP